MDSSRSATVTLEAENAIQGWMKQNTPTLIIRCRERKIDLYITTGMAADVEYGGGHTTRIRLDDGQPFSERWSESTDHEALFSPRALQLARKIAQAKTMRFQFTPFNASPAIVTFEFGIMKWPHSAA